MRRVTALLILSAALVACAAPRTDPRLQAAEDFRDTAFSLIERDEAQGRRLNGLHLGMTDTQVLAAAGAPSRRETQRDPDGRIREVWSYDGELKTLGALTFEDQRLIQILTQ